MNQKILFKFVEKGKLRLTIIGGVLGLSILIIGLHLFLDIKEILYKKVKINEDFLVLNKRIGLLNSVTQKPNTFNTEEIKEFSSVSGVEKIAAFEPSRFKVMMVFNPNSSQFKDVDFKKYDVVADVFGGAGWLGLYAEKHNQEIKVIYNDTSEYLHKLFDYLNTD